MGNVHACVALACRQSLAQVEPQPHHLAPEAAQVVEEEDSASIHCNTWECHSSSHTTSYCSQPACTTHACEVLLHTYGISISVL